LETMPQREPFSLLYFINSNSCSIFMIFGYKVFPLELKVVLFIYITFNRPRIIIYGTFNITVGFESQDFECVMLISADVVKDSRSCQGMRFLKPSCTCGVSLNMHFSTDIRGGGM